MLFLPAKIAKKIINFVIFSLIIEIAHCYLYHDGNFSSVCAAGYYVHSLNSWTGTCYQCTGNLVKSASGNYDCDTECHGPKSTPNDGKN